VGHYVFVPLKKITEKLQLQAVEYCLWDFTQTNDGGGGGIWRVVTPHLELLPPQT